MTAITELRREYKAAELPGLTGIPGSTYYYHCKKAQAKDKYQPEKQKSRKYIRKTRDAMAIGGFCLNCVTADMA